MNRRTLAPGAAFVAESPRTPQGRRHPSRALAVVLAMLFVAASGCASRTLRDGAQLTSVPEGFVFDPNLYAARLIFPDREKVRQRGYTTLGGDETHGSIVITEYPGTTLESEVRRARAAIEKRYTNDTCTPIESVTIDGHPGWAWFEKNTYKGRTRVGYNAVIPWDDATYTVEFSSNDPSFRGRDFMRETVATFTVVRRVPAAAALAGSGRGR